MSKWIGIGLALAGVILIIPLIIAAFALATVGGGGGQAADTNGLSGGGSDEIVRIAQGQLGYDEQPPGSNNVPRYNSLGIPWCSVFVTWVWKEAGIDVPILPCSGSVATWAQQNGQWKPGAGAKPQVGDAVIYGTGVTCPASVHIEIVEKVFPDGRITTIGGNVSDTVKRSGPFDPKTQQNPGPVFGFASPTK